MAAWLETDDVFEAARSNRNRKKKTPVKIATPSPKKKDEELSPVLTQFQHPQSQLEAEGMDDLMIEVTLPQPVFRCFNRNILRKKWLDFYTQCIKQVFNF